MSVEVVKPGLQTTLQSRPRHGLRHRGIPSSGAADPLSLASANRLVGNVWDAPALEAAVLAPTLRFKEACTFAVAGAAVDMTLDGILVATHRTVRANAGDTLIAGAITHGARIYIAFAGGIDCATVLGSASTYLQAGFGGLHGRALLAGDELKLNDTTAKPLTTPDEFRLPLTPSIALRTCTTSETGSLSARSHERFFGENWSVSQRQDRMGIQLEGARLDVRSDGRMPSAAVFPGTVQCPENGVPYLLGVDAGTVGGYPRIAQVARVDRHLIGQLRSGGHVRFLYRDHDAAAEAYRAKLAYWRRWIADIEHVI